MYTPFMMPVLDLFGFKWDTGDFAVQLLTITKMFYHQAYERPMWSMLSEACGGEVHMCHVQEATRRSLVCEEALPGSCFISHMAQADSRRPRTPRTPSILWKGSAIRWQISKFPLQSIGGDLDWAN
ncbi:hypothetical protein EK904_008508, partial [Melospiza melodia maxima]